MLAKIVVAIAILMSLAWANPSFAEDCATKIDLKKSGAIQEIVNCLAKLQAENTSLLEKVNVASALRDQLREASGSEPGAVTSHTGNAELHDKLHQKFPTVICPKGQYIVGLRSWGATVNAVNDLTGIQIFCRSVIP